MDTPGVPRSGGSPVGTSRCRSSCGRAVCGSSTSGELAVRMLASIYRCLWEGRAAKSLPSFTLRREQRETVVQSSVTEKAPLHCPPRLIMICSSNTSNGTLLSACSISSHALARLMSNYCHGTVWPRLLNVSCPLHSKTPGGFAHVLGTFQAVLCETQPSFISFHRVPKQRQPSRSAVLVLRSSKSSLFCSS